MTLKQVHPKLVALIAGLVWCFQLSQGFAEDNRPNENSPKPNILFIVTDDQSALDLKLYNQKSILETPVLDRLAREGLVLDHAYHMGSFVSAVCIPSRYMRSQQ